MNKGPGVWYYAERPALFWDSFGLLESNFK